MLQANQDADMSLRTTLALAAVIILTTAVTASAAAKKQRVPRSGSQAQAVLASLLQTCRQQGGDVLDFLSQTLRRLPAPALAG